jgi:hypothetical protein
MLPRTVRLWYVQHLLRKETVSPRDRCVFVASLFTNASHHISNLIRAAIQLLNLVFFVCIKKELEDAVDGASTLGLSGGSDRVWYVSILIIALKFQF